MIGVLSMPFMGFFMEFMEFPTELSFHPFLESSVECSMRELPMEGSLMKELPMELLPVERLSGALSVELSVALSMALSVELSVELLVTLLVDNMVDYSYMALVNKKKVAYTFIIVVSLNKQHIIIIIREEFSLS